MSPFAHAAIFATALFAVSTDGDAATRRVGVDHPVGSRCEEAYPSAAIFVCYTKIERHLRSEVEAAFRQRLAEATAEDGDMQSSGYDGPHLADYLRLSQTTWVRYVDAECRFEGETSFGGSGTDILEMACRVRLDAQRLADLKAAHDLTQR